MRYYLVLPRRDVVHYGIDLEDWIHRERDARSARPWRPIK
jgi:hypothetical protein